MFSTMYVHGDTATERNENRTKLLRETLRGLERRLLNQAGEIASMLDALENEEDFGTDDAVDASLANGRSNWVARTLADDVLRRDRDNTEDALRATLYASGYEITKG